MNNFCCQQEWTVIKNRKYFYCKTTVKCLSKYKCTKKNKCIHIYEMHVLIQLYRIFVDLRNTALTFLMEVLNYLRKEANPAQSLCTDGMFMHEFPGQCCNGLFLDMDGWWEQTTTLS